MHGIPSATGAGPVNAHAGLSATAGTGAEIHHGHQRGEELTSGERLSRSGKLVHWTARSCWFTATPAKSLPGGETRALRPCARTPRRESHLSRASVIVWARLGNLRVCLARLITGGESSAASFQQFGHYRCGSKAPCLTIDGVLWQILAPFLLSVSTTSRGKPSRVPRLLAMAPPLKRARAGRQFILDLSLRELGRGRERSRRCSGQG